MVDFESKDTKQYIIIHSLISNVINDRGMRTLISGYGREHTAIRSSRSQTFSSWMDCLKMDCLMMAQFDPDIMIDALVLKPNQVTN